MGAGALIFNLKGELLIVKPNYKDHWSIPGGVVGEHESPRNGCIREVKEEIGLDIKEIRFLCVDHIISDDPIKREGLQFAFYGGILNDSQIASIKLQEKELDEYRFVSVEEAGKLLGKHLSNRLPKAIDAIKTGTAVYLENGEF